MSKGPTPPSSTTMTSILRGLLRPLVRTLIRHGVTVPVLYRLLKEVYVEVASDDFALDDKPSTDSRISVLTGVHRRDVRTIRAARDLDQAEARQQTTLLATVVGRWLGLAKDGAPPPLSRTGPDPSFETLVRELNRDIRPRTILDELLRQGLVSEDDAGLLQLRTDRVFGPDRNDQKILFFAENIGDHLAAASANLASDDPPFFERAVFYNNLTAASVDEIEAHARQDGQALLVALNGAAKDLQVRDADATEPKQRFRVGLYFYREEDDASPDAQRKKRDE